MVETGEGAFFDWIVPSVPERTHGSTAASLWYFCPEFACATCSGMEISWRKQRFSFKKVQNSHFCLFRNKVSTLVPEFFSHEISGSSPTFSPLLLVFIIPLFGSWYYTSNLTLPIPCTYERYKKRQLHWRCVTLITASFAASHSKRKGWEREREERGQSEHQLSNALRCACFVGGGGIFCDMW